jgi:hypothetical protein
MNLITELWGYMKKRKKYWLFPVIMLCVFIGLLMAFGGATGLSAFFYPIF